jgi:hypothetical protein
MLLLSGCFLDIHSMGRISSHELLQVLRLVQVVCDTHQPSHIQQD